MQTTQSVATTEMASPRQAWQALIVQRWQRLQHLIATEEAQLAVVSDKGARADIKLRLRGLRLAVFSVWGDAQAAGVVLPASNPA